ncbi:MAG: hypothetical protein AAFQ75_17160, partial [Pseudomonadota bacterium]
MSGTDARCARGAALATVICLIGVFCTGQRAEAIPSLTDSLTFLPNSPTIDVTGDDVGEWGYAENALLDGTPYDNLSLDAKAPIITAPNDFVSDAAFGPTIVFDNGQDPVSGTVETLGGSVSGLIGNSYSF